MALQNTSSLKDTTSITPPKSKGFKFGNGFKTLAMTVVMGLQSVMPAFASNGPVSSLPTKTKNMSMFSKASAAFGKTLGIEKPSAKLSDEQLFERADKAELLHKVFPEIQKMMMDVRVAPSAAYDREIAPLMDNGDNNQILITGGYKKMRHLVWRDKKGVRHEQWKSHLAIDAKEKGKNRYQVGKNLHAPVSGKVVFNGIYGNTGTVVIQDDFGLSWGFQDVQTTTEAKTGIDLGARVTGGQILTKMAGPRGGKEAYTGSHFHFWVKTPDGKFLNPEEILKNGGYLGTIQKSKFAQDMDPRVKAAIQSDDTGDAFVELMEDMADKKGDKITAEWVKEASLAFTRNEEGGKNDDTNTNHGLTSSAMFLTKKERRHIMKLPPSRIKEIYDHYYTASGADTLSTDELYKAPGYVDAFINHNPDYARKMLASTDGEPQKVRAARIAHVKKAHGRELTAKMKKHLYGRYNRAESLSLQMQEAIEFNDGYMASMEDLQTIASLSKVKEVVTEKEKDFFMAQQEELRQKAEEEKAREQERMQSAMGTPDPRQIQPQTKDVMGEKLLNTAKIQTINMMYQDSAKQVVTRQQALIASMLPTFKDHKKELVQKQAAFAYGSQPRYAA